MVARRASKTKCILRRFNLVTGLFKVEGDRARTRSYARKEIKAVRRARGQVDKKEGNASAALESDFG